MVVSWASRAHNNRQDPYNVLRIAHDGSTQVFNSIQEVGTSMNHQTYLCRTAGLVLSPSLVLSLSAAVAMPAWASKDHGSHGAHGTPSVQAAASEMTEGEVRKVDKDAGKLTLRHADIKSLDMPAMTMVFQVTERALLDKVKVGDKVRFRAEKAGGAYVVTAIEAAK
jgi:Cu/Ag efflux protein CusF